MQCIDLKKFNGTNRLRTVLRLFAENKTEFRSTYLFLNLTRNIVQGATFYLDDEGNIRFGENKFDLSHIDDFIKKVSPAKNVVTADLYLSPNSKYLTVIEAVQSPCHLKFVPLKSTFRF